MLKFSEVGNRRKSDTSVEVGGKAAQQLQIGVAVHRNHPILRRTRAPGRGGLMRMICPERADAKKHRLAKGSSGGRSPAFDAEAYNSRDMVERCINRLKLSSSRHAVRQARLQLPDRSARCLHRTLALIRQTDPSSRSHVRSVAWPRAHHRSRKKSAGTIVEPWVLSSPSIHLDFTFRTRLALNS